MKPLTFCVLLVVLAEVGAAMTMLNASPHQPVGFWLWFGGIAVLAPFIGFWLYRRIIGQKV